MVFIFYLSAQSRLPNLDERLGSLQSVAGHLLAYAVLALLLRWSLAGSQSGGKEAESRRATRWAFVLALAYGITDEVHQYFVPGRHMDLFDLLTDAAGAAAALWVAGLVAGRRAATTVVDEAHDTDLP
jgi:VanZ family protein